MSAELLTDQTASPQRFMLSVEKLRSQAIRPLDFGEFANNTHREGTLGEFGDQIPKLDGLYIPTKDFHEREANGQLPSRVSFSPHSGLSVGREDSRNKVFFGPLVYHHFDGRSQDETATVAVKPFIGTAKARFLGQEIGMIKRLNELEVETPRIVGLFQSRDDRYLITAFRPEVITLDSIDWKRLDDETRSSLIDRGLGNLLEIHKNGIYHGDAEPRNLTVQPNMNAVWHVDLEHTVSARTYKNTLLGVKKDLRDFYSGITRLSGSVHSFENMVSTVLEPYERNLLRLRGNQEGDIEILDKITKLLPMLCEEFAREFAGEPINNYEREHKLSALSASEIGHSAVSASMM